MWRPSSIFPRRRKQRLTAGNAASGDEDVPEALASGVGPRGSGSPTSRAAAARTLGASGADACQEAAAAAGAAAPAAAAAPATPAQEAATVHSAIAAVLHNEGLLYHISSGIPDLADRLRLSLVSKLWLRALLQEIALPKRPSAARSLPALVRLAGGALRTLDISRFLNSSPSSYLLTGETLLEAVLPGGCCAAGALTSLVLWREENGYPMLAVRDHAVILSPDHVARLVERFPGLQRGSSQLYISCESLEDMSRLCSTISAIPGRHLVHLSLDAGTTAQTASRREALRAALEQAAGHRNLAGVTASCGEDPETARLLLPLLRAAPQGGRRCLTLFELSMPEAAAEESNAALFAALGECDSVETLLLNSGLSRAPPADLQAFSSALRARAGALRHLRLCDVACRALLQPGTPLASLAEASLPHLLTLSMSECGLDRLALSGLAAALVAAPQLSRANLSNNPLFPSVNGSFRAFVRALAEHCPRLELLLLDATLLGGKCAVLLASALAARRTPLRELHVAGNNIGAAGAAALISIARVEKLSAEECDLQDGGVTAVAYALSRNSTLKQLDLGMNNCEEGKGPERIFAELARNTTLTHLNWKNTQFPEYDRSDFPGFDDANNGDGEAEEDDDGVQTVWSETEPDTREQWNERVADALSNMLRVNSTLQQLQIYPGGLCRGLVERMSAGLALNTGLQTLEIDECCDSDLEALGLALRKNTTLRALAVGTGGFEDGSDSWTDSGAVCFASIIGGWNKTLRHLAFGDAPEITRVGALALAAIVLGSNEHLFLHLTKELVCDGTDGTKQSSVAFSALLPKGLQQKRVLRDVGTRRRLDDDD